MKKIAFLFPGQGSQAVGMLNAFAGDTRFGNVIKSSLQVADKALGESISSLIEQGPAETLNLTVHTQPAMLAADVAIYECWKAAGGTTPDVVAGHSLGEYAALVVAGVLAFDDAVRLVRLRAQAMQESVPVGKGGMAAILGLSDDAVLKVCAEATEGASIAEAVNFNAPAQVVIAGAAEAIAKACELAKATGAKRALPLPVSAPFHSSLMKPAGVKLAQALSTLNLSAPQFPYVNNVDVASPSDAAAIADALVRQAWRPVRWVETILAMQASGVTHFVECGPGKVLAGLVKRICDVPVSSIYDPASLDAVLAELAN